MEQEKEIKAGQKTISIRDDYIIELMNKIAKLPKYSKSQNKILNDALKFGIPRLYKELYGVNQCDTEKIDKVTAKEIFDDPLDREVNEFMSAIINLLKEQLVEIASMKFMVSSLFNLKSKEMGYEYAAKENFDKGNYKTTPEFLRFFERQAYKNIRGED